MPAISKQEWVEQTVEWRLAHLEDYVARLQPWLRDLTKEMNKVDWTNLSQSIGTGTGPQAGHGGPGGNVPSAPPQWP